MAESGKVVKFEGSVTDIDGNVKNTTIYRIGAFNLLADNKYVVLNHELGLIQELSQQPEGYQVKPIADFEKKPLQVQPSCMLTLPAVLC